MKLDLNQLNFFAGGRNLDGQATCSVKIGINGRTLYASAYRVGDYRIHIGGFTRPTRNDSPILEPIELVIFDADHWFFRRANVDPDDRDLPVESTAVAYSPRTFEIICKKSKYKSV